MSVLDLSNHVTISMVSLFWSKRTFFCDAQRYSLRHEQWQEYRRLNQYRRLNEGEDQEAAAEMEVMV